MLAGLGLVLGLPVGKLVMSVGTRWIIFSALGLLLPLFPVLLNYVQNNPPKSFHDVMTWIGVSVVTLSFLLRLLFGAGFTGRLLEHLAFSTLYDVLKGIFNLVFTGLEKIFTVFFKLLKALLKLF